MIHYIFKRSNVTRIVLQILRIQAQRVLSPGIVVPLFLEFAKRELAGSREP